MMRKMLWIFLALFQLIDYSKAIGASDSLGWSVIPASPSWLDIENAERYGKFTASADGTLDSIRAYLRTTAASKSAKFAIFKTSDSSLVDTTKPSPAALDTGWRAMDFEFGSTIYADTVYALAVWGASGGGEFNVACTALVGIGWYQTFRTFSLATWENPVTPEGGHIDRVCIMAFSTPVAAEEGQIIIISGED